MNVNVAILGASGFVGAELLRLAAQHPALTPARLFGDSQAGQSLAIVHPHLAPAYPGLMVERFEPAALDGVDLVFAALPHGESQKVAPLILARGIPFVDLGADFRLDTAELARLASHETKLIVLTNPNNPTGALIGREQLEEIARIARGCGAWVLCDEVYRGTDQEGSGVTVSIADLYEKGISTGSMSKAFSLAGLRLGWICAPK